MTLFRVIVEPRAEKELRRLPKHELPRMAEALRSLAFDPYVGKKLRGEWDGHRSLRVWPYRIIYVLDHAVVTITVLAVGHRKNVYR